MSELPENWIETTIGEVYDFIGGGTPSKSIANYWNGDIPWASIKDISQIKVLEETQDSITELGLKNSATNLAQVGDVILGTRMLPGKAVLTNIITAINQDLKIVKPKTDIPSKFTLYQFTFLRDEFLSRSGGTTVQGITIEKINEIRFLLPPLPEQKRIVAKLDKLFAHHDKLKARLEKVPELLKQFRQAVLTQAVTGKLTEEWRGSEDLSGWVDDIVGNFMAEVKEKVDPNESDETNYIGLEHIESNGGLIGRGSSHDVKSTKTAFKKNDVLYGKLRPYLNKHILAEFDGVCSTDILVYRNENLISSKYFNYWLSLDSNIQIINAEAKGINLPRVSASTINGLSIPIPPEKEQKEIVRRLESLFSLADKIEASYQKLREKADHLPQAILAKAFRGELVEQDPSDGSAEELLKVIKQVNKDSKDRPQKKPRKAKSEKTSKTQTVVANIAAPLNKRLHVKDVPLTSILQELFGSDMFRKGDLRVIRMDYNSLKNQLFEILDLSGKLKNGLRLVMTYDKDGVRFKLFER